MQQSMPPRQPKPQVRKPLQVSSAQAGMRLDLYLAAELKISRKKAKALIDQGQVFLGSKKIIIASWELKTGDEIQVGEPAISPSRKRRYLKVYYEDADLIIVEKPPGVPCEKTPQTLSSTLVDDINDYLKRTHPDKPYPYVGLMHRLDRETSGLMVYTLSKRANRLSRDFKFHKIERRYLALVEGAFHPSEGRIALALRKDPHSGGRKMQTFRANKALRQGRAITDFWVKERYNQASLIEARLLTGRTHQVRVHLASKGHPVMGDTLYGSKVKTKRHLLHAAYLEFMHPITKKKMKFHSELPKDFLNYLEKYRSRA